MKIDFQKKKIPFTQVANDVLNDPTISFKAKGLYAFLYSKPDGWDFESKRIADQSKDGRDSVRSALIELETAGYLKRHKLKNGRMVYLVVFPPMTGNPSQATNPMTENPNDGKSHSGKTRPISNKDIKVIKKESKKEASPSFLKDITPETIKEMTTKFKCEPANVRTYALKILDYCEAKGRTYKNYKAALRSWLRKDFGDRPAEIKATPKGKYVVKDGRAVWVSYPQGA